MQKMQLLPYLKYYIRNTVPRNTRGYHEWKKEKRDAKCEKVKMSAKYDSSSAEIFHPN